MIPIMILPLVFLLTACGTLNKSMGQWVGKHQDELVGTWGPPTNMATLTDGRHSLVYVTQGSNTEFGLRCYGTCRKVFTTDKAGMVQSFNYSGCC